MHTSRRHVNFSAEKKPQRAHLRFLFRAHCPIYYLAVGYPQFLPSVFDIFCHAQTPIKRASRVLVIHEQKPVTFQRFALSDHGLLFMDDEV